MAIRHIYPEDFGAVGDGAHDDATALQAALDSIGNNIGGSISLGAGSYRFSSQLTIHPKTTIVGMGRLVSVLKYVGAPNTKAIVTSAAVAGPNGHIVLRDLNIHNDNPSYQNVSGLDLSAGTPETVLDNVAFSRWSKNALIGDNSWSVRVRDCFFTDVNGASGDLGTAIYCQNDSNAWEISGTTFIRCDRVLQMEDSLLFSNLKFNGNSVELIGYKTDPNGNTVANTSFPYYFPIVLTRGTAISYINNYHEGIKGCLMDLAGCFATEIRDNYIQGTEPGGQGGAVVLDKVLKLDSCRNVTFTRNYVDEYITSWVQVGACPGTIDGAIHGIELNHVRKNGAQVFFPTGTMNARAA